jgi:hypothetical protein
MRRLIPIALAGAAAAAAAPAIAGAQQVPPAHLINAPDASSPHVFANVLAVRALPSGQVLVNDGGNRQLLLLSPTLQPAVVVADSTSGSLNSYGVRSGALIPYVADSSLFIDPAGLSMFVITPAGTISRVASVPRSQDAGSLGAQQLTNPGVDAQGRIVYRGLPNRALQLAQQAAKPGQPGFQIPDPPDSVALVRIDLATRKLDTAAFYKIAKVKMNMTQTDRGFTATSEINPMPVVDDWALLSDGSIAIARGQDYHIDWVGADGAVTPSAKLPFDWQRMSDDDKAAVLDSAKAAIEKARNAPPTDGGRGAGNIAGQQIMVMSMRGGDGVATRSNTAMPMPGIAMVDASELPDYRPAFTANSMRGDMDDNVWIRTTATRAGTVAAGPIYDVVNRKGELVDRVQVPAGRSIIGFAKGGVVYMLARDGGQTWLERTHRATMP